MTDTPKVKTMPLSGIDWSKLNVFDLAGMTYEISKPLMKPAKRRAK